MHKQQITINVTSSRVQNFLDLHLIMNIIKFAVKLFAELREQLAMLFKLLTRYSVRS